MLKTALYVRLEAKPGKEDEVEAFLNNRKLKKSGRIFKI